MRNIYFAHLQFKYFYLYFKSTIFIHKNNFVTLHHPLVAPAAMIDQSNIHTKQTKNKPKSQLNGGYIYKHVWPYLSEPSLGREVARILQVQGKAAVAKRFGQTLFQRLT